MRGSRVQEQVWILGGLILSSFAFNPPPSFGAAVGRAAVLAAGVVLVAPVLAPLEQRWMERVKAHRGARAAEVAYVAASVTVWVWLVGGRWALSDPLGALAFGAVGDLVAWVYDRLLPRESRAAAPGQAGSKDTRPGRSRAE